MPNLKHRRISAVIDGEFTCQFTNSKGVARKTFKVIATCLKEENLALKHRYQERP